MFYRVPNTSVRIFLRICWYGKSSKPTSETVPRRSERIWGITFAEFCGIQRLIRDWGALRIYCWVPFSAAGIAHLFESTDDLYIVILSSRWEYMKSYLITRNMLAKTFWISSGTRTAFPMGVAPEAIVEYLYLAVGSNLSLSQYFETSPSESSPSNFRKLLYKVALEHLNKNLYLVKGSRDYQYSFTAANFYNTTAEIFPLVRWHQCWR